MIVLPPLTGSIAKFAVRTMPTASNVTPFKVRLKILSKDTNKDYSTNDVTASYNAYDFLEVTASLVLPTNQNYSLQIIQLSGSEDCTSIFRGELFPTNTSATVRDSNPFFSYTGSNNEYIVYP